MTAVGALVQKELSEVMREKRLPVFALVFATLGGVIVAGFLGDAGHPVDISTGAAPPAALAIAMPLFFLDLIGLIMLTAVFVLDAVGKERDAGMLGLLLTTTATPGSLLVAKLVLGIVMYVIAAMLGIAVAAIVGLSLGAVVPTAIALAYAGPLLALFGFLVGTGLLLSVITPNGRLAVALGIGVNLPLFLLGGTPLFASIALAWPAFAKFVSYTPYGVASDGMTAITTGTPTPWLGYAITAGIGLASAAIAYLVMRRQEVAQG
jgi:ABC-type transport system involved in multi-copper enzyme maturation permease subunit